MDTEGLNSSSASLQDGPSHQRAADDPSSMVDEVEREGMDEQEARPASLNDKGNEFSQSNKEEDDGEEENDEMPTLEDEIFGDSSRSSGEEDSADGEYRGGSRQSRAKGTRTRTRTKTRARKTEHKEEPTGSATAQISERVLEARREFDEALEKVKSKGRRRKAYEATDPVDLDEMASKLRRKMEDAAIEDHESIERGQAAVAKHKLLPQVIDVLNQRHMQEILLDAGILTAVRVWLEPLPNRVLPSDHLRKSLLEILRVMPVELDHLRESGLGRIIMFFARRPKESPEIQRISKELVARWSRPIVATGGTNRIDRDSSFEEASGGPSRKLQSASLGGLVDGVASGRMDGNLSLQQRKIMQHFQKRSSKSKRTL